MKWVLICFLMGLIIPTSYAKGPPKITSCEYVGMVSGRNFQLSKTQLQELGTSQPSHRQISKQMLLNINDLFLSTPTLDPSYKIVLQQTVLTLSNRTFNDKVDFAVFSTTECLKIIKKWKVSSLNLSKDLSNGT